MSKKKGGEASAQVEEAQGQATATATAPPADAPGPGVIDGSSNVTHPDGAPMPGGTPIPAAERQVPPVASGNGQVKPKLTKRQRFLRYAPSRVQNVLDSFRRLKNCTNKSGYEFSESEAQRIVQALTDGLSSVRQAFAAKGEERSVFTLEG